MPRFVKVPSDIVKPWRLRGTAVIEGTLNGTPLGRRTIKRSDDRWWFIDLPETLCRHAKIDTGDTARLEIKMASASMPSELADLLEKDRSAREAWNRLSASRQRMLREHVMAAKRFDTRCRRAADVFHW